MASQLGFLHILPEEADLRARDALVASGQCPCAHIRPGGAERRRCGAVGCRHHMYIERNGDEVAGETLGSVESAWSYVEAELDGMPYHCIHDFVVSWQGEVPIPFDALAEVTRLSRQSLQDIVESAMDNPAWCALEG